MFKVSDKSLKHQVLFPFPHWVTVTVKYNHYLSLFSYSICIEIV